MTCALSVFKNVVALPSLPIPGVGLLEPVSADLGTARPVQNLGGRDLWFVGEIGRRRVDP